jgi:hypothetical protein
VGAVHSIKSGHRLSRAEVCFGPSTDKVHRGKSYSITSSASDGNNSANRQLDRADEVIK